MKRFNTLTVIGLAIGSVGISISTPALGQIIVPNDGRNNNNDANEAARAEQERQARQARAEVQRAETALRAAATRVRANWKAQPDLIAAEKELDAARKDRDAERNRVVHALESDAAYKKLKSEHKEAAGDVKDEQDRVNSTQPASQPSAGVLPDPSTAQIAAATEKLEKKSELRNFEDRAVAADDKAAAATTRFDSVQEKLKALQLQLQAALLNDPEYKAAQDQVASARARITSPVGR